MGVYTASTSAVREDVERQQQKVSHRKKPNAQKHTSIRNGSPLAVPVAPFDPAYYFPPSRAEPPKTINQKKKSSSKKRSSSRKRGSHSRGSNRSHPHTAPPSYFNSVNQQSKSVFAPNQFAAEYLDAYFNYLNAYASNQEMTNEQRA